jgi:hypothetical protein
MDITGFPNVFFVAECSAARLNFAVYHGYTGMIARAIGAEIVYASCQGASCVGGKVCKPQVNY